MRFIHPSTYGEGLSNVLLESAAMGRVLLTTTVPGCNETVEEGLNGFHFEPNNRSMMIDVVEKSILLSTEKKAEMGKASRCLVEKKFSREIVVTKYHNLVKDLDTLG